MYCRNGREIKLTFQHGWGFDSGMWQQMAAKAVQYTASAADRGYFGETVKVAPQAIGHYNVIICHSLGLHLCEDILSCCDLLVVMGGFINFHGEDRAAGVFSKRHVKRMIGELEYAPKELLYKFHRDCSYVKKAHEFSGINSSLLLQDLQFLDTHTFEVNKLSSASKVLIMHGNEDRIVPIERGLLLSKCFSNSIFVEIDGAGHGLPFTHYEQCWQIIQEEIEKINDK